MESILRIARETSFLEQISTMYQLGLEMEILGRFSNHAGFDGVMIGNKHSRFHLEFTYRHGESAPRSNSKDNLLVFYVPNPLEWEKTVRRMSDAGFIQKDAINPYWNENGITFEDLEGYRIVISKESWDR
ncbi:MAG: hypothetical protein EOP07_12735 [Proteobacteria bacterium]|nr:MAG: hypothetical protein EOP07_12735 [Pseudomonadota bacterium]